MKKSILLLYILLAVTILVTPVFSHASVGVFNDVQTRFQSAASGVAGEIQNAANRLFWILGAISLAWTGITLIFRKGDVSDFFAEFVRFILFFGFFNWLLINGSEMAKAILESFRDLGGASIGTTDSLDPSGIIDIGFNLWNQTNSSITDLPLEQIIPAYLLMIAVIIIIGLIGINVLILNVTAWIFAYAGIFVLGFGGSKWTSDIAINYFKQLLNLGLQILTMIVLVGIGKKFIDEMTNDLATFIFFDFIVILLCVLLLLYLTNKVPAMVGSLAGGSGNGGAGMLGGGAAMAGLAMAGGALMGAAASATSALKGLTKETAGLVKAFQAAKSNLGGSGSDSGGGKMDSAIDAIQGANAGDNSQQDGKPLATESGGESGHNSSTASESAQSDSNKSSGSFDPFDNNNGDFRQPENMVPKTTNTGGGSPLAAAMGTNLKAAKQVATGLIKNKWEDTKSRATEAIDKSAGGRLAKQWEKPKGNDDA